MRPGNGPHPSSLAQRPRREGLGRQKNSQPPTGIVFPGQGIGCASLTGLAPFLSLTKGGYTVHIVPQDRQGSKRESMFQMPVKRSIYFRLTCWATFMPRWRSSCTKGDAGTWVSMPPAPRGVCPRAIIWATPTGATLHRREAGLLVKVVNQFHQRGHPSCLLP